MNKKKYFIYFFISTSIVLLSLIACFNYAVDPLGIFRNSAIETREVKLAKFLSEHDNVLVTNINERKFVKARIDIENVNYKPDTIVFGSSRVMPIGNNLYNNNVFNLGVNDASLEDLVVLSSMATKKFNPKLLIIGVDPWIFNDANNSDTNWHAYSNEYIIAMNELGLDSYNKNISKIYLNSYKDFISFAYTRESFNYFLDNVLRENKFIYSESDSPLISNNLIRKDGSRIFNLNYANLPQESIIRDRMKWVNSYSMNNYTFSNYRLKTFELLIRKYKKNHQLLLLLLPYHPSIYSDFLNQVPIILNIESIFRTIAFNENIKIIGSYNPKVTNCESFEFYDGSHPKESCISKIFLNMGL